MIQDVKTHWNSTILMLERACRLKEYIKQWLQKERYCKKYMHLYPTREEWKQITYVISILHPFLKYTLLVSRTRMITMHKAWQIYNKIFNHIEVMKTALENKRLSWKVSIRNALGKAHEKLDIYYSRTVKNHGVIYNSASILDPSVKLSIYDDNV